MNTFSNITDPAIISLLQKEPISNMQWIHRSELNANLYNPNRMAGPEFNLLTISIIEDGWLFPICALPKDVHNEGLTANEAKDKYTIIDGFHRYENSGRPEVYKRTHGYVPVVFPTGPDHIATTVRMNRIKGTHTVLGMAEIIQILLSQGKSLEYVMQTYGMESEEVYRLANRKGIPKSDVIGNGNWSQAWTPE